MMNFEKSLIASDSHGLLLNISYKTVLKRLMNMLIYQILEYTIHV